MRSRIDTQRELVVRAVRLETRLGDQQQRARVPLRARLRRSGVLRTLGVVAASMRRLSSVNSSEKVLVASSSRSDAQRGRQRLVREDHATLRVEQPHALAQALHERALHRSLRRSDSSLCSRASISRRSSAFSASARRRESTTRPEPARQHELDQQRDDAGSRTGLSAGRQPKREAAIEERDARRSRPAHPARPASAAARRQMPRPSRKAGLPITPCNVR